MNAEGNFALPEPVKVGARSGESDERVPSESAAHANNFTAQILFVAQDQSRIEADPYLFGTGDKFARMNPEGDILAIVKRD